MMPIHDLMGALIVIAVQAFQASLPHFWLLISQNNIRKIRFI
jgi:hypothetical protein